MHRSKKQTSTEQAQRRGNWGFGSSREKRPECVCWEQVWCEPMWPSTWQILGSFHNPRASLCSRCYCVWFWWPMTLFKTFYLASVQDDWQLHFCVSWFLNVMLFLDIFITLTFTSADEWQSRKLPHYKICQFWVLFIINSDTFGVRAWTENPGCLKILFPNNMFEQFRNFSFFPFGEKA